MELDEAALIDGASVEIMNIFQNYFPTTETDYDYLYCIYLALSIWNDYILASTFLSLKGLRLCRL